MKQRLTLLLFCLVALCARGQNTPSGTQVWWGYWNSLQGLAPSVVLGSGTHTCGLRLEAVATPQLHGAQAHAVRFALYDKTAVGSVQVQLGRRTATDVLVVDVPAAALKDQLHDGALTEVWFDSPVSLLPVTNPYAYISVGVQLTTAAGQTAKLMASTGQGGPQHSCIVDGTASQDALGTLALQLLVSNDGLPALAVQPQPFETTYSLAGQQVQWVLPFRHAGVQPVSSMDYEVTVGTASQTYSASFTPAVSELDAQVQLPVTFGLPADARLYDAQVRVTKLNGQDVADAALTASVPLYVLSQLGQRRSVMEEFTGTWCPNCPRGDVGIRLLSELFADRFVAISIHNGDPMTFAEYDQSQFKRSKVDGYPSCTIDRYIDCDPYQGLMLSEKSFQTDMFVNYALQQPTVADVELTAQWTDDTQTKIDCHTTTTFHFGSDVAGFAFVYVLTADSLVGDGNDWLQVNTFAGSTEWDEPMNEFTQGTSRMKMAYNNVAVAVDGVDNGLAGSVVAPFACDVPQTRLHRFDVGGNTIIQDRQRVNAIAMLLDTGTGRVMNVAKTHVLNHNDASGVSAVKAASQQSERWFAPDGRPVGSVVRPGLYLRRLPDGTTRKELRTRP